jgi:hypothetical protein
MPKGSRHVGFGFAAALAALLLAWLPAPRLAAATAEDPLRVVAVGDIHGHFDGFVAILREAGLIDARLRWTGGRAILVQTGDYTDRGDGVRAVLELLMDLERQAARAGGRVITLLGNHEVMNMLGELRDVTPEICETFADARSEARRERAWRQYERLMARQARGGGELPPVYQRTRDDWMTAWPLGCLEYYDAMGPRGTYGRWLRTLPVAAVVQDTLFMHAGPHPDIEAASVDEINARIADEIARYDRFVSRLVRAELALPFFTLHDVVEVAHHQVVTANARIEEAAARGVRLMAHDFDVALLQKADDVRGVYRWWTLAGQGPLWFRGYASWDDEALAAPAAALLERLGVRRLVVGHSVMPDARIRARLDARVFLIDTGMLPAVYRGEPSALELHGAAVAALYLGDRTVLVAADASPD